MLSVVADCDVMTFVVGVMGGNVVVDSTVEELVVGFAVVVDRVVVPSVVVGL